MRATSLIALALLATACDDKDTSTGDTDTDVVVDTETVDTEVVDTDVDTDTDTDSDVDPVARGAYLVNHVAACGDCHTPRLESGAPDTSKFLAGGFFADLDPEDDEAGALFAPNLTPDATGLGDWTDAEIAAAITGGHDKDGNALFPAMPYWAFAKLTDADAAAIVAYLGSIDAVANEVPDSQATIPVAVPALSDDVIPQTTLEASDEHYDDAQRGRYLVTVAACLDCHTVPGEVYPIDTSRILAGGRTFPGFAFGLDQELIYTRNLTPDENGIAGWTAETVKTALLQGEDQDGVDLCPPMPAGPMGAYGGLTEEDALAIGWYLTTIPAVASDDYPECPPAI